MAMIGVLDARAKCRDEGERQDQAREGQEDVRRPASGRCRPSRRDSRRVVPISRPIGATMIAARQGDVERDAGAVDDAAEDVAAEFVGAEPMRGGRRLQPRARGPARRCHASRSAARTTPSARCSRMTDSPNNADGLAAQPPPFQPQLLHARLERRGRDGRREPGLEACAGGCLVRGGADMASSPGARVEDPVEQVAEQIERRRR